MQPQLQPPSTRVTARSKALNAQCILTQSWGWQEECRAKMPIASTVKLNCTQLTDAAPDEQWPMQLHTTRRQVNEQMGHTSFSQSHKHFHTALLAHL